MHTNVYYRNNIKIQSCKELEINVNAARVFDVYLRKYVDRTVL